MFESRQTYEHVGYGHLGHSDDAIEQRLPPLGHRAVGEVREAEQGRVKAKR